MEQVDFEIEQAPETDDTALKSISRLASEQLDLIVAVTKAEEALGKAKAALLRNVEIDLPTAMLDAGQLEITTIYGKIKVETLIVSSVPAERLPQVEAWLQENGHADIIKRDLALTFGRDQSQLADMVHDRIVKYLEAQKQLVKIKDKKYIHPATLGAFVREKAAAGTPVPEALFGIYEVVQAKVTQPKKKGAFE